MVTTDWISPETVYERGVVGREWGFSPAEMQELVQAGVLRPLPISRPRRPLFLGQELLDAVARRLQPREEREI